MFIDKTWEKIKTQKELNLPDQRSMVANYRCNELKEESLELIEESFKEIKAQSEKGLVKDFNNKCKAIMKQSLAHYEEYAHQYENSVFKKV